MVVILFYVLTELGYVFNFMLKKKIYSFENVFVEKSESSANLKQMA